MNIIDKDSPDIICLTEIFSKYTNLPLDETTIKSPTILQTFLKRDVVIYIKNTINAEIEELPSPFQEYSSSMIKLSGNDNLLVCCVYRSPNSSNENNNLNYLIDIMENTHTSHVLLVGDFNYKEIDWEKQMSSTGPNHPSTKFLETIRDKLLSQHVISPTRYRENQTPSTLDLIFTNDEEMVQDITYGSGLGKSDHITLSFKLICYTETAQENQKLTQRNFFKGHYEEIKKSIADIDCNHLDSIQDVDVAWNYLTDQLKIIIEKCIPANKGSNSNNRRNRELREISKPNGEYTKTNKESADTLNKYFASVFVKDEDAVTPPFRRRHQQEAIVNTNISEVAVLKAIKRTNPNKSPGPDNLHPKCIFETAEEIKVPLRIIFKKSLESSKLPLPWKEAIATPIHKKGSKKDPSNYRPISLTSVPSIIMQRIIRVEIIAYMDIHNLLTPHQHGFRTGKSCVTQLLESMENWISSLDSGENVDVIYLNFSKAFDKVSHKFLLHKLDQYGISGKLLGWIKAFLNNMVQRVSINGVTSESVPVTSVVPQGSVLGPTLFLIYVNDMPDMLNCTIKLFADDIKMYRQDLQNNINQYATPVTSPALIKDKIIIENIQRRATKRIPSLKHLSYHDRLKELGLPTLEYRRERADIIQTYKILNKLDILETGTLFQETGRTTTRGHSRKIYKRPFRLNKTGNFYSNRVINIWNSLPEEVISAPSINAFKSRINKHWNHHPAKFRPTFY
ncbi:uncharacterized protein LOC117321118 [Pecten maximus]|uniref:uncharacterized protein LOC117321118 n=1 Tax=Pecten maximus TaxID=6579 RepID=UPI001457EF02|nr:uncharacterized protein LOC117321118 [Pecten maximus]